MMRRRLCWLVFLVVGMVSRDSPSLGQQGPTRPAPPPASSPNTSAPKINEKLVALTPLEEAEQLCRMGKCNEAIERYNAIIRSGTDTAAAYAGLARAYLKLKKPSDAYLSAQKAIEHDASLGTAHSALGEVYFRQGKLHEAQTEFLTALKLGPADAQTYFDLARFDRATYDFKKAKVAVDQAHSLDPTDPEIDSAWVETRSLSEQVKALEDNIASQSKYYSRTEKARFKQRLTLMKDEIEHPERTCGVVSQPGSTEMPLTPIGEDFTGLEVYVNGVRTRLVLSTVSSGIVINGQIAEEAGVQPITRTDMDALGEQNPPEAYTGFARSLKLADLEFQNCYVTVVERASPRSFYDQFEGLIAAGFFSAYLVDMDIPNAKLTLQPLPLSPATEDLSEGDAQNFHDRYTAPEMARWTQMYHFSNAILIPAQVNGSPPVLFEVATSSKYNVLAPGFARERASLRRDLRSAHLEGINGRVSSESSGKVKLALADLHFKAIKVISFDDTSPSNSAETEIAGYLGFDLLRNLHFTIDYRDGLIHFIFAPRIPEGPPQSAPSSLCSHR
jgi:tetratricopeptide (TPR) repeat protein